MMSDHEKNLLNHVETESDSPSNLNLNHIETQPQVGNVIFFTKEAENRRNDAQDHKKCAGNWYIVFALTIIGVAALVIMCILAWEKVNSKVDDTFNRSNFADYLEENGADVDLVDAVKYSIIDTSLNKEEYLTALEEELKNNPNFDEGQAKEYVREVKDASHDFEELEEEEDAENEITAIVYTVLAVMCAVLLVLPSYFMDKEFKKFEKESAKEAKKAQLEEGGLETFANQAGETISTGENFKIPVLNIDLANKNEAALFFTFCCLIILFVLYKIYKKFFENKNSEDEAEHEFEEHNDDIP